MSNTTDELSPPLDWQGGCPAGPGPGSRAKGPPDLLDRQQAVVAMGRRAIAPPDVSTLMQDAAALLAEALKTEYSAVAEPSTAGPPPRLRLTLRKMGTREADPLTDEPSAAGTDCLAGYALEVAQPVVVDDLVSEDRFDDAFLSGQGIRAAIAAPLKLQDRSFGSLVACTSRPRRFDDEDLLFVETIAHLVTTAIARIQAENSLADQERFAAQVLQTIDALVLVLNPRCQVVEINPTCRRTTGFSLEEIKGRTIWNVFCIPQEVEAFRQVLEGLDEKRSPAEHESELLTKHSQRRRIAWTISVTAGERGAVESIIATGIDITRQREAEDKADRAIQDVAKAQQALAHALLGSKAPAAELGSAPPTIVSPADARRAFKRLGHLPPGVIVERRRHPRRAFPYKQRIAPVLDGKLPDRRAFVDVQCKDIAASGFSFLSPQPPASDTLVVALGVPPKVTYLIARVIHVTRVDHDEQRKFVIGCNYVGRAVYDQATGAGG